MSSLARGCHKQHTPEEYLTVIILWLIPDIKFRIEFINDSNHSADPKTAFISDGITSDLDMSNCANPATCDEEPSRIGANHSTSLIQDA